MCDYTLTVCVKEWTPQSERAIADLRRILSNGLVERCRLEIVDVPERPDSAVTCLLDAGVGEFRVAAPAGEGE